MICTQYSENVFQANSYCLLELTTDALSATRVQRRPSGGPSSKAVFPKTRKRPVATKGY